MRLIGPVLLMAAILLTAPCAAAEIAGVDVPSVPGVEGIVGEDPYGPIPEPVEEALGPVIIIVEGVVDELPEDPYDPIPEPVKDQLATVDDIVDFILGQELPCSPIDCPFSGPPTPDGVCVEPNTEDPAGSRIGPEECRDE